MSPTAVSPLQSAVFVDRDGTLIEEVHYCREPNKVRLFDGVPEALTRLRNAGYRIILVTNQSGIARGKITLPEYEAVHSQLLSLLGPSLLDAAYMCPDGPESSSQRRKPAPGMLLEAAADWNVDLSTSFMIGDKEADIECGHRAGSRSILVQTGYGASQIASKANFIAQHLPEAADWILRNHPLDIVA